MRMLAKDPAGRPASAGELGREALALLPMTGDGVAATRTLPLAEVGGATGPAYAGARTVATGVADAPRGRAATDTDPGFRLPTPGRTPSWLPWAALALGAVLLLLLVRACGSEPDSVATVGGGAATKDSASAPATVDVVARDYLGRPEPEVRAELGGLGLRVESAWSGGGGEVGTVKGVSPTGAVEAGSLVTLAAVAQPRDEDADEDDEDEDRGAGPKGHSKDKARGHGKGKDD
jgi:hypothetical protein